MSFTSTWVLHFLLLLPFAALTLYFNSRQKKRTLDRLADPRLMVRLIGKDQKIRRFLKSLFLLTAFGLMIFALAGPRWGGYYQEVTQKGIDIMILVDVSPSMLVEDIQPNRLERARQEILDFLKVVQGDRLGLVAFSKVAIVHPAPIWAQPLKPVFRLLTLNR
jgi:Ca-activated chloride channel family protein